MRMRTSLALSHLLVLTIIAPSSASALTVVRGTNSSETVWVGMVDVTGDGVSGRGPVACWALGSSSATFSIIGTTSGLDDDYAVHGDASDSGTGNDWMSLIVTNGTAVPGPCGAIGGTWNRLTYNGYFLDLAGDAGNETRMHDGGGSGDTFLSGNDGNDFLQQWSSIGWARGDDDDDTVYGFTGTSADVLYGDDGDDCLWDGNNSWLVFHCGNGSDRYSNLNSGTMTSCETSDASCGGF